MAKLNVKTLSQMLVKLGVANQTFTAKQIKANASKQAAGLMCPLFSVRYDAQDKLVVIYCHCGNDLRDKVGDYLLGCGVDVQAGRRYGSWTLEVPVGR